jgi:hypothetical protein
MVGRVRRAVVLAAFTVTLLVACLGGVAAAAQSGPLNWATQREGVVCGVAAAIEGTALDPDTGAELNGLWPGLQCQTTGLPRGPGAPSVGDPAVHLGQGRAGRARLVYISQDELISQAPYAVLAPGTIWTRDGITCTVGAEAVSCANAPGYGFTMSPGHVDLFAPAGGLAIKKCGGVSYTFPHTGGHGHEALNNLTAVGVSCATAQAVARALIVSGRAPRHWRATMKQVPIRVNGASVTVGEVVLIDGDARVVGDIAN